MSSLSLTSSSCYSKPSKTTASSRSSPPPMSPDRASSPRTKAAAQEARSPSFLCPPTVNLGGNQHPREPMPLNISKIPRMARTAPKSKLSKPIALPITASHAPITPKRVDGPKPLTNLINIPTAPPSIPSEYSLNEKPKRPVNRIITEGVRSLSLPPFKDTALAVIPESPTSFSIPPSSHSRSQSSTLPGNPLRSTSLDMRSGSVSYTAENILLKRILSSDITKIACLQLKTERLVTQRKTDAERIKGLSENKSRSEILKKEFAERQKRMEALEKDIRKREESLRKSEEKVERKERDLVRREEVLRRREETARQSEETLQRKEREVRRREDILKKREEYNDRRIRPPRMENFRGAEAGRKKVGIPPVPSIIVSNYDTASEASPRPSPLTSNSPTSTASSRALSTPVTPDSAENDAIIRLKTWQFPRGTPPPASKPLVREPFWLHDIVIEEEERAWDAAIDAGLPTPPSKLPLPFCPGLRTSDGRTETSITTSSIPPSLNGRRLRPRRI